MNKSRSLMMARHYSVQISKNYSSSFFSQAHGHTAEQVKTLKIKDGQTTTYRKYIQRPTHT